MLKRIKPMVVAAAFAMLCTTPALAADGNWTGNRAGRVAPAAIGTVSSVSGSIIYLIGSDGTAYTVDATSAAITKLPNTTIQVSDISGGDTLRVFGTVSGTSIAATKIMDGVFTKMDPATTGTVSSVDGSLIYLTGSNGTAYTIDASGAIIDKSDTTIQVSGISSGDTLRVFGTLSGANITATKIMDGVFSGRSKTAADKTVVKKTSVGKNPVVKRTTGSMVKRPVAKKTIAKKAAKKSCTGKASK
jgi:hypothetical protein